MIELSVVIPVYMSEEGLPRLLQRLAETLPGHFGEFEAILVVDGSPDRSFEVLRELAPSYPFLRAYELRKNVGQDNAIMAGLARARGKLVAIMDDDLQHDPDDLPAMADKVRAGWDACFANFRVRRHAWWKNLGSRFNGRIASLLLGKPGDLYLSPFKVLSHGLVREIITYRGPYPYVDGLIVLNSSRLTQVAVEHHPRLSGRGNYNMRRSLRVWLKLATGFSIHPLRAISFVGFLSSAMSMVGGMWIILRHVMIGYRVEGWASLMVTGTFLGGIQLVCLGMIGEYVGRAYLLAAGHPIYGIRDSVGSFPAED
jgi:undecaprenyl-phosphate 4-deoxy-4-formamido-L-arabinose transferase